MSLTDEEVIAKTSEGGGGKRSLTDEQVLAKTSAPASTEEPFMREARETLAVSGADIVSALPPVRAATAAVEPIIGAAAQMERPFGGKFNVENWKQLKQMQARGSKALDISPGGQAQYEAAGSMLSPVSGAALKAPSALSAMGRIAQNAGYGALGGVTTPTDKASDSLKSAGWGAAGGGALGALGEGARKAIGFGKDVWKRATAPATAPTEATDPAAQGVQRELQRIKDVVQAKKVDPKADPAALSQAEKLVASQEELVTNLNSQIIPNSKPVNLDAAFKAIETVEKAEVNPGVLSAHKEVKKTLADALQKSGPGGASPFAGMTTGQRAAWGAFIKGQSKTAPEVSLDMADKLRQSIQEKIDKVGEGQVSNYAKDLLGKVKEAVTASARTSNPSYGKYLDEYGKNAKQLEEFTREGSALSKLTRTDMSFEKLAPQDAQNYIDKIFTSDTPGREMKQLVELTKQNPEAAANLRKAYGTWLMEPAGAGVEKNKAIPEQLFARWAKTRDAVWESGLFTPEHFTNVTKIMDDLAKSRTTTGATEAAATVVGFLIGMQAGHPVAGSHMGRQIIGNVSPEKAFDAMRKAIEGAALMPEGAQMLSQAPTPDNVEKVLRFYSAEIGRDQGEKSQRRRQSSVPNPFGQTGTASAVAR